MANQNIRIPRFYPCLINFLLSRGITQDGEFDVTATGGSGATATVGLASGTKPELLNSYTDYSHSEILEIMGTDEWSKEKEL